VELTLHEIGGGRHRVMVLHDHPEAALAPRLDLRLAP